MGLAGGVSMVDDEEEDVAVRERLEFLRVPPPTGMFLRVPP